MHTLAWIQGREVDGAETGAGCLLLLLMVGVPALVGGGVGYLIGNSKGLGGLGFILGLFLGIIGWIIVALMSGGGTPRTAPRRWSHPVARGRMPSSGRGYRPRRR